MAAGFSNPSRQRTIARNGASFGARRGALSGVLLSLGLMSTSMLAHADLTLAEKSTCLNCHAVDKKLVGPSFTAIAAKYRGQANAVELLQGKVEKGGTGVWGAIPMPPMAYLPKADVAAVVKWIVELP